MRKQNRLKRNQKNKELDKVLTTWRMLLRDQKEHKKGWKSGFKDAKRSICLKIVLKSQMKSMVKTKTGAL